MRNPAFSSTLRSGAPVPTTIQAWLSVSGGALGLKAERSSAAGSFSFGFVDWVKAPANNTAAIGTQSNKDLLKRLISIVPPNEVFTSASRRLVIQPTLFHTAAAQEY